MEGGFCGTTRPDLIFVPGRVKLESAIYVRMILEPALVWVSCKRRTLQGIKGIKGVSKPTEG